MRESNSCSQEAVFPLFLDFFDVIIADFLIPFDSLLYFDCFIHLLNLMFSGSIRIVIVFATGFDTCMAKLIHDYCIIAPRIYKRCAIRLTTFVN